MTTRFLKFLLVIMMLASPAFAAKERKKLLITGCGRSGTTFISRVLEKCGLDVPHERMGRDGSVSWYMCFEDHHLGRYNVEFDHIFHQVRHPLKTISSVYYTYEPWSWNYITFHIPEIKKDDPLIVKSAKYWYYWNLKAEEIAEWTYKIENIDYEFGELYYRLGFKLDSFALNQVPRDTNTRDNVEHQFTWKELQSVLDYDLFLKIQGLAWKYGYSIYD